VFGSPQLNYLQFWTNQTADDRYFEHTHAHAELYTTYLFIGCIFVCAWLYVQDSLRRIFKHESQRLAIKLKSFDAC